MRSRSPLTAGSLRLATNQCQVRSTVGFPSNREGFPYAAAGWSAASLVLDGRHQCGGAVSASAVVEVLAPGHHDLARLSFGGEVVPGQDLVLEGREERLRSSVIETRTDPAHRLRYSELSAQCGETRCGVGRSAIGVEDHTIDGGTSAAHRGGHLDRVAGQ